MPVFWLSDDDFRFPPPAQAEDGGLLGVSADLKPKRLLQAYFQGVFPWFEHEGYYYWFSPYPRCVLFPDELVVHKSMRSIFNQHKFRYTLDTRFEAVMRACAQQPRRADEAENGSWITDAFLKSYTALHRQGLAHSVEVWQNNQLVGGLYGVSLGRIFFGESMFSRQPNASKAGFITLVRALQTAGFRLIDCQQSTTHLQSLGARDIPRDQFLEYLTKNSREPTLQGRWELTENSGIRCHTL